MNIKRIIREEMDDMDWIKDIKVDPFIGYFDTGYESVGFIVETIDESKEAQKMLFQLGYSWFAERGKEEFMMLDYEHPRMLWVDNNKDILQSSIDYIEENTDIVINNPFKY
jgi:hypothetical protein